jgi:membrane protease YdiL (CAAX protease family)
VTQWAAFAALTALVLLLLLGLARLSQGAVRDDHPSLPAGSSPGNRDRKPTGHVSAADDGVGSARIGEFTRKRARHLVGKPGHRGPELTTPMLLANVALTQGFFGTVVLGGVFLYDIPLRALGVTGDPWSTGLPAIALGAGFGVALWGANEASASVADAVGAGYDEQLRGMLSPDSRAGWTVLLGGVLPVIAFVEEFIFRAAAIGAPAAGFDVSPWALAIVSSTAFAFGHGAQGRAAIAVTGTLGFVLATGYIISGSLLVVVIAHYLVNALEFLVHEALGVDRLLTR